MDLSALPVDLLPGILAHLVRRNDLSNAALVNHYFHAIGTPLLYRDIRLFGRDLAIVPLLFRELALSPALCRLLRRLEIRVYPLSMILKERLAVEQQAVLILRQATGLQELLWTRQGSLTDRVLEAIVDLPDLRSFEFNGHTNLQPGSWSAELLTTLPKLRRLAVIMPDRNVASVLPLVLAHQAELEEQDGLYLEELTILSRESISINDKVIQFCTPHLSSLTTLALAGCSKLTNDPLLSLVSNLPRLQHLALEATSITPSFFSEGAKHLTGLISLKLTHPGPRHPNFSQFWPDLMVLLASTSKLRALTVYHSGTAGTGVREWLVMEPSLVEELSTTLGSQLHKLELSGILLAASSAVMLAEGFPELRDLVIHLGYLQFDPILLGAAFSNLTHLKTLHLQCQRTDVPFSDIISLSQMCSPTLRQIGLRNQVWLTKRELNRNGENKITRFVESAEVFGIFRRSRYGAEVDALLEEEGA